MSPVSDEKCKQIIADCQFEKMAKAEGKKPDEERFFRRRKPGGVKETFSLFQRLHIHFKIKPLLRQLEQYLEP